MTKGVFNSICLHEKIQRCMYTCMEKNMLKVAKARYDGCLWTAQDDEVMLGLSGVSQLGTVWGFLEIFVGQGASHRTDVNDHVIARLDPLNLSLAESSPPAVSKRWEISGGQSRTQRHDDAVIDVRRSFSHGHVYPLNPLEQYSGCTCEQKPCRRLTCEHSHTCHATASCNAEHAKKGFQYIAKRKTITVATYV